METLKPLYKVLPFEKYNTHYYRVDLSGSSEYLKNKYAGEKLEFPSVTNFLSIIGGQKTNGLMNWAVRESLSHVKTALCNHLEEKTIITNDWIDNIFQEAKAVPEKLKNEASDLGSMVHNAIDSYLKGVPQDIDDKIKIPFNEFVKWFESSNLEVLMGDTPIANLEDRYGGRFDCLCFNKKTNKYVLIDLKTSNSIHDEMALQVGAYCRGIVSTYGIAVGIPMDKDFDGVIVKIDKFEAVPPEIVKIKSLDEAYAVFCYAKDLKNALKGDLFDDYTKRVRKQNKL